jgi:cell wall-associated NlpC family hydrolase
MKTRAEAVLIARTWLETPYILGGRLKGAGCDCGSLLAETKCRPAEKAQPGDLVLFRAVKSKLYNHGAIVTAWPWGIHAYDGKVRESNLATHRLTGWRDMAIFDPFVTMTAEG